MFVSNYRDKMAAGIGSVGAAALIGYVLLSGLTVSLRLYADDPLVLLNLKNPQPQIRTVPPPEPKKKAERMRDHASAANRKNKASPIVAPRVVPLVPSSVIAAPLPNIGSASANGASDRTGPGQGAGGAGDGLGGGGEGDEGDTPPRQIKGKLNFDDMPSALRVAGVERHAAVRYQVDVDGRVNGCAVTASTGSPEFDGIICQLIEKRFRFKPSRDGGGQAVPSIVEEEHSWRLSPGKSGQGEMR